MDLGLGLMVGRQKETHGHAAKHERKNSLQAPLRDVQKDTAAILAFIGNKAEGDVSKERTN